MVRHRLVASESTNQEQACDIWCCSYVDLLEFLMSFPDAGTCFARCSTQTLVFGGNISVTGGQTLKRA